MENKTAFNQKENGNLIITSLIAFLGMVLLIAIAWFLKIPNPNMVLITGLIIFTGMFGRTAGVISAALIILYSMFFIINTTIVATLRYRWKKSQKELIKANGQLREHNEKLKTQSETDPLTGLFNRHALRANYHNYVGINLIVAYMDVDNFKQINDNYGHDAGDDVLRTISNGLKEFFTNTDAYRYGGDEFLLIRKDLDTGLFANQLHQMRNRMDELSHSDNKPDIKFSAGYVYGVAETADDLRSMFEKADELMYEVKRHGKEDMLGQRYA